MGNININNYFIAIIIILLFLFVSVVIWVIRQVSNTSNKKIRFPPWTSPCPDYWTSVNGKCKQQLNPNTSTDAPPPGLVSTGTERNGLPVCNSSHMVNTSPYSKVDFAVKHHISDSPTDFSGMPNDAKCKWASKCGVHWEGISNVPGCTFK
jgi:hypothetical protein